MTYIGGMQVARIGLSVCALGFALTAGAESRPLDTYKSIIDRNPFGLKDPPTPPVKDTNPPPTQVKKEDFYLTGISTIGNPKRPKAYLLAKDASKKEYDQKFYNLSVGDRQGDVTLQEIDPKGRRVKIAYLGEEKWLSMKDNGVPGPTGVAPGMPGAPGAPMVPGMTPAGGMPAPVPLPLPNSGGGVVRGAQPQPVTYPNASNARRTLRTAGGSFNTGGIPAPTYNAPGAMPISTISGAPGVPTGQPGGPTVPAGPQTDAEVAEQIIRMQATQEYQRKQGIPTPPIPTF